MLGNREADSRTWRSEIYRLREQRTLLFTFAGGFILLVFSSYAEELFREIGLRGSSTLGHLIREIGFALLVGGYIAMTIEKWTRRQTQDEIREYVHEVGDRLIGTVYGKDIPDELFETIKVSAFEEPFIRKHYINRIYLHDFTEQYLQTLSADVRQHLERFREDVRPYRKIDDIVVFRTITRFDVENVSSASASHNFTYAIDVAFPDLPTGLAGINSVLIDGEAVENSVYTGMRIKDQDDRSILWYSRDTEILPGRSRSFEVHSFSLRLNRDKEAWFFPYPQQGAIFDVEDLEGNKDIKIALRAPTLANEETVAYKNKSTNIATLQVNQYLLPYQAIDIKWWPSKGTSQVNNAGA